ANWILISGILENDRFLVGFRELAVILPPGSKAPIPAGVLGFEPLEVTLIHSADTPIVDRPSGREELSDFMNVPLLGHPVPHLLDVLVVDLNPVLLQRQQEAAVIIVVNQ